MATHMLALILLVAIGCGTPSILQKKTSVPIDKVPEVVMKTVKEKQPDINFSTAAQRSDGVYEVQGKNKNGKVIEVEVKENGDFVGIE
jgi:hypothetical protein